MTMKDVGGTKESLYLKFLKIGRNLSMKIDPG